MSRRQYAELVRELESSPEYWAEVAIGDFTEEICRLLEERKLSRADLARGLGTSQAYITKILRGQANFTLASMAKLAFALGSQVRIHLAPTGSYSVWKDCLAEPDTSWLGDFSTEFTISTGQGMTAFVEPWLQALSQVETGSALATTIQPVKASAGKPLGTGGPNDPRTVAA